jgi:hypothetical protein
MATALIIAPQAPATTLAHQLCPSKMTCNATPFGGAVVALKTTKVQVCVTVLLSRAYPKQTRFICRT